MRSVTASPVRRLALSLVAVCWALPGGVAPLAANALGLEIVNVSSTGACTTLVDGGDVITFDLLLENASQEDVFGLRLVVFGYDAGEWHTTTDNRLIFAGGQTVGSVLNVAPGSGGLANQLGSVVEDEAWPPFHEFPIGPRHLEIFDGVSLVASNGTGGLDIGINGIPIGSLVSPADVHFQVSFMAQALDLPGDVTLTFGVGDGALGSGAIGLGGAFLAFDDASWTMTVIPEPSAALLVGLGLGGLVGLASARGGA